MKPLWNSINEKKGSDTMVMLTKKVITTTEKPVGEFDPQQSIAVVEDGTVVALFVWYYDANSFVNLRKKQEPGYNGEVVDLRIDHKE